MDPGYNYSVVSASLSTPLPPTHTQTHTRTIFLTMLLKLFSLGLKLGRISLGDHVGIMMWLIVVVGK